MASISTHAGHGVGIFARLSAALDSLRGRAQRYVTYRKTLNELNALGARELDDLGISKRMIRRIAYQTAYEQN